MKHIVHIALTFLAIGAAAQAHVRERGREAGGILDLARQIDRATGHLVERAEVSCRPGSREERWALGRLRTLHHRAGRFRDELRDRDRDVREAMEDYRDLRRAYEQAHRAVHGLARHRHLKRDLAGVGGLLDDLRDAFGHRLRPGRYYR